jgi:hypothetical protein
MSTIKQIQENVALLPPEKQIEVLDFIFSLQQQINLSKKTLSLQDSTVFGIWKDRQIDPIAYQQTLRAEWHESNEICF